VTWNDHERVRSRGESASARAAHEGFAFEQQEELVFFHAA
jgi:hypothetical protein